MKTRVTQEVVLAPRDHDGADRAGGTVKSPLDRPLRLIPQFRHYDWGTRDFIPLLCGREPGERAEAELWFGAHPDAPADVVLEARSDGGRSDDADNALPLDRLIAERRSEFLGPGATGNTLPFLTKIISASRPLSIQAHPDREQARRGFAAEARTDSADPLSPDDPMSPADRTYRDPNHKPELLYALTPFLALSGFRPAAEAAQFLAALGLEQLRSSVRRLESDGASAFRPLLEALHRNPGADLASAASLTAAAKGAARRVSREGAADRREAMRWVVRIAARHPDDPMVLAPLFLRLVHLEPGEALFTGPGVLHSYLEGSALEVMANSDNVLRLGLTSKPVAAEELLDILVYEADDGGPLAPRSDEQPWGTRRRFRPPVDDFRLDLLHVGEDGEAPLGSDGCPRIALALEGEIEVANVSGSELLRPGQAVFLAAAAGAVTAAGPGTLALTTSAWPRPP